MKRIYVKQRAENPLNTRISARTEIMVVEVYSPGRTPSEAIDRNEMTVSRLVTNPPVKLTRASAMESEAIIFKNGLIG